MARGRLVPVIRAAETLNVQALSKTTRLLGGLIAQAFHDEIMLRIESTSEVPQTGPLAPKLLGLRRAFSLIELMCVMAIIVILATLFLGAADRAFARVKAFVGESDSQVHLDELQTKLSKYASEEPNFPTLTLDDLVKRCALSSRCARFLRSKGTIFYPFSSSSPGNMIILQVERGKAGFVHYPKASLCVPPEEI